MGDSAGRPASPGQNLDRVLDAAIVSYSRGEPRPGLEQRVMANVRSETAPSRSRWVRVPRFWLAHFALAGRGNVAGLTLAGAFLLLVVCAFSFWSLGRLHHSRFTGTAARVARPAPLMGTAKPPAPRQVASNSSRATVRPPAFRMGRRVALQRKSAAGDTKRELMPAVFPTPSPLTAEEHALLVLALRGPEELQLSLSDEAGQPISIAAIHVEPLPPLASSTSDQP